MGWLEYSFPFRMTYFQGRSVSFRECTVCFCLRACQLSKPPPNFVVEQNCRCPIPSRFRGQYADDQKHGFGTFTWQAGEGGPVGDEDTWLGIGKNSMIWRNQSLMLARLKKEMSAVRLYFMKFDADSSETSCIVWVCEHSSWFFDGNATMFFLHLHKTCQRRTHYSLISSCIVPKHLIRNVNKKKRRSKKIMLGKTPEFHFWCNSSIQIFTDNRCRGAELFLGFHQHHP